MKTINDFVKYHPVLSFFALVFAIGWGSILILAGGPGDIPTNEEQFERLMPWLMVVWLAGPSVAGIVLTGLVYGREGFRNLLSRMRRWRVGAGWYALALLTAPLLYVGVSLALLLTSPEFVPGILATSDKAFLLLFGIGWGPIGGARLDGVRHTRAAKAALRCAHYRAYRRGTVGSVSLACKRLGRCHSLGSALRGHLPTSAALLLYCSGTDGLQGAYGVGLQAYW
jgi:hypothetical protein